MRWCEFSVVHDNLPPDLNTPPSSTASATASATHSAPAGSTALDPTGSSPSRGGSVLLFGFRSVVDEESVEGQRVGENVVANIVAPNRERVERLRFPISKRHLDRFQMRIHRHVHPYATSHRQREALGAGMRKLPVMVPWTTVPFFSSTVTVSLLSFICAVVQA